MELLAVISSCVAVISVSVSYIYYKYLERERADFESLRLNIINRTENYGHLVETVSDQRKEIEELKKQIAGINSIVSVLKMKK